MTRLVNVSLDTVVRLELPDDHPYFHVGRDGTDEGTEQFAEVEMELIDQAQAIVARVYTSDDNAEALASVVFNDASVEDVTAEVRG